MKIRIIQKPEYTCLWHVQVKRWWWPFWSTVHYDQLARCTALVKQLEQRGEPVFVHYESEV